MCRPGSGGHIEFQYGHIEFQYHSTNLYTEFQYHSTNLYAKFQYHSTNLCTGPIYENQYPNMNMYTEAADAHRVPSECHHLTNKTI